MGAIRDSSRFLLVVSFVGGLYVVAVGFEQSLWLPLGAFALGMIAVVLVALRFQEDYAAEASEDEAE